MMKYRFHERELTGGGVYQDHTRVDRFEEYDINLDKYGLGRTPSNETSPHNYIHIFATNNSGNIIEQRVLDFFNIPVNFPVTFFTRKVPFTSEFRCGFSLKTYETFNSTYYDQAIMTRNMFSGLYDHINLSGNFTNTGEFIDDEVHIEISNIRSGPVGYTDPNDYSKYNRIKQIITDTYGVSNFVYPDSVFENGVPDYYHFKIRHGTDGLVIKFYNWLNEPSSPS
jgi:hypothetical protein